MTNNSKGFTLIEMMIVFAVLGLATTAFLSLQSNQLRSANYTEFQSKRSQLTNSLTQMFLNNPNNCACLFNGSNPFPTNPALPGAILTGVTPTTIGPYNFISPGVCGTATIPKVLAQDTGIDHIELASVQLTNILNVSGSYVGDFIARIRSTKKIAGPNPLEIKIPVNISTTPNGSNVDFASCSTQASGSAPSPSASNLILDPISSNNLSWSSIISLSSQGGSGLASGSLPLNLSSFGADNWTCGPLRSVTITHPQVNSTTRMAILSMYNAASTTRAAFFRVFSQNNRFIGAFGQASRNGDGKGYGSAGSLFTPLDNRRFKIQACGRDSRLYTVNYAVLGTLQ